MREMLALAAIAAAVGGCSCGADVVHVDPIEPGCEVLDPGECLLPWPTSHYIENDASETARQVAIPAAAMPANSAGVTIPPDPWNAWDGFSAMTSMAVRLRGDVDDAPLSSWRAPVEATDTTSPTLLLDATTGMLVSHYAEIQRDTERDPDHTLLYVRPAARLEERHHYVVAVRGLSDTAGIPIAPMAPFRALRDGLTTDSDAVEARRAAFETEVFGPLARAMIPRADLIVAWDFWTADGAHATGDLVAMVAAAASADVSCALTAPPPAALPAMFEVEITVPSFLTASGSMSRDEDGTPIPSGQTTITALVYVPESAGTASPLLVFGHGLFTSRAELGADYMLPILEETGAIGVAIDVEGLNDTWGVMITEVLLDLSGFTTWIDGIAQSLLATSLLPRAIRTCGALAPGVGIDPSRSVYVGHSQGAILGITLAALSPDVSRFALGVGGIAYPIMLPRSTDSGREVLGVLAAGYARGWDAEIVMVMFATQWDRIEGAAFAPHVLRDRLVTASAPGVLFQVGAEDTGTPNIGSEIAGRTMGLPVLEGSAHVPPGMETAPAPLPSAYVVYDYGVEPLPDAFRIPPANCVHQSVRRDPAAQAQSVEMLETGRITNHCDGGVCTDRPLHDCGIP